LDEGVVQVLLGKTAFQVGEVSEGLGVQEVEQVEQLSKVIIQWCTGQENSVDAVEGFEFAKDEIGVRFD